MTDQPRTAIEHADQILAGLRESLNREPNRTSLQMHLRSMERHRAQLVANEEALGHRLERESKERDRYEVVEQARAGVIAAARAWHYAGLGGPGTEKEDALEDAVDVLDRAETTP